MCGFLLVFFLPGYLFSLLFVHEFDSFERIVFSIGLSIATAVTVSFFLTAVQHLSGAPSFSQDSVSAVLSSICIVQLVCLGVREDATGIHRP
jgi:uncharacterized membrane protein